jgi:hypothetical protein
MMFEIVAVGAIATQFELRIPNWRIRERSDCQSSVSSRRDRHSSRALRATTRPCPAAGCRGPTANRRSWHSARAPARARSTPNRRNVHPSSRTVGERHCFVAGVRLPQQMQAVLEAHDAEGRPADASGSSCAPSPRRSR